jgi:hypothetical protein
MSIGSILKECEQKGIILKTSDYNHIEIYGPRSAVTPEMVTELKDNKGHLLKVLNVIEVFEGAVINEEMFTVH